MPLLAKLYWTFSVDSKFWLTGIGGLPMGGGIITSLLAGVAAIGFIPTYWFTPLIIAAAVASILLWGVPIQGWSTEM